MHAFQEAKGLALALNITARPAPAADSPETANAVYIGDHQVCVMLVSTCISLLAAQFPLMCYTPF